MTETITQKLLDLGFSVGRPVTPIANYVQAKVVGSCLYISNQLPIQNGVVIHKGKIGDSADIETGKKAAEICLLNALNQIIFAIGDDISKIKSCVKLEIFINCTHSFERHSEVANAASDMLIKVLGEKGRHTRVAIGVLSLPMSSAVSMSSIFEIQADSE